MTQYILAYRFNGYVCYWSNEYGWTRSFTEATRFDTLEEATLAADSVGAFVLTLLNGEIVD